MLLHTICGLSYGGDVRMGVAEDGGKVAKIAAGSREGLLALYAGALQVNPKHTPLCRLAPSGLAATPLGYGVAAAVQVRGEKP